MSQRQGSEEERCWSGPAYAYVPPPGWKRVFLSPTDEFGQQHLGPDCAFMHGYVRDAANLLDLLGYNEPFHVLQIDGEFYASPVVVTADDAEAAVVIAPVTEHRIPGWGKRARLNIAGRDWASVIAIAAWPPKERALPPECGELRPGWAVCLGCGVPAERHVGVSAVG